MLEEAAANTAFVETIELKIDNVSEVADWLGSRSYNVNYEKWDKWNLKGVTYFFNDKRGPMFVAVGQTLIRLKESEFLKYVEGPKENHG